MSPTQQGKEKKEMEKKKKPNRKDNKTKNQTNKKTEKKNLFSKQNGAIKSRCPDREKHKFRY